VTAGMKELNEMTIGRTDDPENPLCGMAFEAASLFGTGSRTPSGPAVMAPHEQAGHMIAIDLPVRLTFLLHPRGRPHMPQRAMPVQLVRLRFDSPRSLWCSQGADHSGYGTKSALDTPRTDRCVIRGPNRYAHVPQPHRRSGLQKTSRSVLKLDLERGIKAIT
jgi:hypothetical protein